MEKKETGYRTVNFEDDIHTVPLDDLFVHEADANCPCHPFIDPKNRQDILRGFAHKYVWVHRRISDEENKQ